MDPCALISILKVLNVENITKVQNRLATLRGLSHPMEECLDHALLKFSREVGCLQENAQLVIYCEGQQLEFVSGQGEGTIKVSYIQRAPHYRVHLPDFDSPVEKLPSGMLVRSLENLDKVMAKMICWREMPKGLKSCLEQAKNGFSREPQHIQDHANMVVWRDGQVLRLSYGEGTNTICIFQLQDGSTQYTIDMPGWWDKIVKCFTVTN